jgi:uncharacterized protein YheU (UPF0270 family)
MIIPHNQIEPGTLLALIEEFVTRPGAIHGHAEMSVERMVAQVLDELRRGRAVIVFDEKDESCSIVGKDEAKMGIERDERPVE